MDLPIYPLKMVDLSWSFQSCVSLPPKTSFRQELQQALSVCAPPAGLSRLRTLAILQRLGFGETPWEDWDFTGNRRFLGVFTGFKQQNLGLELARIKKPAVPRNLGSVVQRIWPSEMESLDMILRIPSPGGVYHSFYITYHLQLPHVFSN